MPDTTLLERTDLPRPDVTQHQAADLLKTYYKIENAELRELGSQQDRNYLVEANGGRFVLKVCRAEYSAVELEAQNAAMHHLAGKEGMPKVPMPLSGAGDAEIIPVEVNGQSYNIRLLTFLDGEQLTRRKHLAEPTLRALGEVSAKMALGLADFSHPGLERDLQWDLRRAGPVALKLLATVSDSKKRDSIAKAMISAVRRIQPLAASFRVQAIHQDVTDDNVVSASDGDGHLIPYGVIDFGDLIDGWLVGELAVTCTALLHHADGDPFYVLPTIEAFCETYPLNPSELRALWPLIVARAGILAASGEQQLSIDPDNEYVMSNIAHEREIFETATSVPLSLMETAILLATGMAEAPSEPWIGRLLPEVEPQSFGLTDLSVTSEDFVGDNWQDQEIDWKLLAKAAADTGAASTRYGEHRLSYTKLHSAREPSTFALHVDICLPAGTRAAAPFAGTIKRDGQHLLLATDNLVLHIYGLNCPLETGTAVDAADSIGVIAGAQGAVGGLRLQLCRDADLIPPLFARPSHADTWSRLCPDPSALLGVDLAAPALDSAKLLERRDAHFAKPQKHYYAVPPEIERGRKEHMFATTGRAYLDMVNNVAIVGHGDERLARAAGHQWRLLNTNSRFHYAAVADYAARLAELAPDGLDTVYLVNSGSEAVDLALRLAWAHTGKRNMVSLLEAYHGWTVASDAVSTSIADNPLARETRPDWVHAVTAPNTYRGPFRGSNSVAGYVDAVKSALDRIEEAGTGLAGFICEAVYGNAGGIPLPQGYLHDVYALIRARGGVCIADEVQVGFGRLGHHFWGFEQQDVVPDIITVAKGIGNGQPLGAVITTREIAENLEREGYFFSSSGGSPVSCAVGMTVLDIMESDKLQDNARIVGDHLKSRLEAIVDRYPLAGAVHGMGLYLGLEFVRDRETLEPAMQETAAICERLLSLGVIMQPTGDHLNVLKIKPPLCLSQESADFFADMLEKVLAEGW